MNAAFNFPLILEQVPLSTFQALASSAFRARTSFSLGPWCLAQTARRTQFSNDFVPFLRQRLNLGLQHEDAIEMYYNIGSHNGSMLRLTFRSQPGFEFQQSLPSN